MNKLKFLIAATFIFVMLAGNAFAWNERSEGRPSLPALAQTQAVLIWHDNNDKLHLTATSRGNHSISGVIKTDGRFYDIQEKQLENGDYLKINRDRNTIQFRFSTGRSFDGVDFKVRGGHSVTFDLFRDGAAMPKKEIYIGKKGWHPLRNSFKLER
jgi:hypothetical protein